MGDFVTLDIVDRPDGGAIRALRTLRRTVLPPGCRGLVPGMTGNFYPGAPYTLRRFGLVAAWESEEAADDARLLDDLSMDSREHWHVRGDLVHGSYDSAWRGWAPDFGDNALPAKDQPLLVLISGDLHPHRLPAFVAGSARAATQAARSPGYLGGCGFSSSVRNTTSVSAWRSAGESRAFAFKQGAHHAAMTRDLDQGHHRTQHFLRIAPTRATGTLRGRNPFADVAPDA